VTALISTRQAARLAGVTPSTIRTWVHRGYLPITTRDNHGGLWFRHVDVDNAEHAARQHDRNGSTRARVTDDVT